MDLVGSGGGNAGQNVLFKAGPEMGYSLGTMNFGAIWALFIVIYFE